MKDSQILLISYEEVVNSTQSLLTKFSDALSKNGISTHNINASIGKITEVDIRICFTTTSPESIVFTEVARFDSVVIYVDDTKSVSSDTLAILQGLAETQ